MHTCDGSRHTCDLQCAHTGSRPGGGGDPGVPAGAQAVSDLGLPHRTCGLRRDGRCVPGPGTKRRWKVSIDYFVNDIDNQTTLGVDTDCAYTEDLLKLREDVAAIQGGRPSLPGVSLTPGRP